MAEAALLIDGKSVPTYIENVRLYVLAFAVVLVAELIGIVNIPVGPANIVILPLLWALLIGALWSLSENWLPASLRIGRVLQWRASAIVQLALLLLVAKLGLLVGGSLPKLAAAGGL
jgi:predicted permease